MRKNTSSSSRTRSTRTADPSIPATTPSEKLLISGMVRTQQITTRDDAILLALFNLILLLVCIPSALLYSIVFNSNTGSTASFTPADNHNLNYCIGMLQSWNKFCFTRGYIEIKVLLPRSDENSKGYVSTSLCPLFLPYELTLPLQSGLVPGQWKLGKTRI
jgi:hypothetical protein